MENGVYIDNSKDAEEIKKYKSLNKMWNVLNGRLRERNEKLKSEIEDLENVYGKLEIK